MTRADLLFRVDECARLATVATDPNKQIALQQMRELWLGLIECSDECSEIVDREFDRVLAIHLSIQGWDTRQRA